VRSATAPAVLAGAALLAVTLSGCGVRGGAQDAVTAPARPPATTATTTTRDPGIPDEVVASWGRQSGFFIDGGFEILEWEDAQALLRERDTAGGKQYHTGWLTIYTNAGRKVLTKQPEIDSFFRFMQEAGLPTTGFGTE
jgi:hypothetical protein